MIDAEGYRANVGIVLVNKANKVFWAQRVRQNSWQFPQGGVHPNEPAIATLYRELYEEIGLRPQDVEVIGATTQWHKYQLPTHLIRPAIPPAPLCIGQKQKWFLLRFIGDERSINFNTSDTPEFCNWDWVHYWTPIKQVISFKRQVYRKALEEFYPLLKYRKVRR